MSGVIAGRFDDFNGDVLRLLTPLLREFCSQIGRLQISSVPGTEGRYHAVTLLTATRASLITENDARAI